MFTRSIDAVLRAGDVVRERMPDLRRVLGDRPTLDQVEAAFRALEDDLAATQAEWVRSHERGIP